MRRLSLFLNLSVLMAQPFQFVPEKLSGNTFKFKVFATAAESKEKPNPVLWQDFWSLMQSSGEARSQLNELLAQSPFPAFFFECPPLTASRLSSAAEFVLVNSPSLAKVEADREPFSKYIDKDDHTDNVVVFPNLRKDATLVVPCRNGEDSSYAHLARFTRAAPATQRDIFWKSAAQAVQKHMSSGGASPLWVSTSGLGVYWLHLRLDSVPKYYSHAPYKASPKENLD